MKKLILYGLLLSSLFGGVSANAATQINVVGLFGNKAVVIINNGKPQTMAVGQTTIEGVKLLSANSSKASFLVEGKQRALGLGQAANVASLVTNSTTHVNSVTLFADSAGHFVSQGQVNGKALKFLVDTGATFVALNSGDAQYVGIDYKRGQMGRVAKANGLAQAYHVTIDNIKIGGLSLSNVDAVIIEGGSPPVVLFGMTALSRLSMKNDGSSMTLTKKY